MSDYWKSQERKYCDFCKCWLSNNKPSIEFHEKGKRHKENVAKRLKTITKKSVREKKNAIKMDEAIRKMEQAGLEAYKKDLENNADLTSRSINEMIEKNNLALAESSETSSKSDPENRSFADKNTPWYEVKAVDGRIYYWNNETDESIWEPPEIGYLTIKEQQLKRDYEGREQLKQVEKQRELEGRLKIEQEKAEQEEQRAAMEREKLKAFRVKEEPDSPEYVGALGPEMRPEPYGQWKTVEVKKEKVIDLQLPDRKYIALNVPIAEPEPIQRTFKEKTVKSLDDDDNFEKFQGFKKRKLNSGQKKNVRQRLDD